MRCWEWQLQHTVLAQEAGRGYNGLGAAAWAAQPPTDVEQAALLGTVHHQERQNHHGARGHEVDRPPPHVHRGAVQLTADPTSTRAVTAADPCGATSCPPPTLPLRCIVGRCLCTRATAAGSTGNGRPLADRI